MLADGTVLVVGGEDSGGNDELVAELYDPSSLPFGSWTNMAAMNKARSYHSTVLLLPSGKVFTAGGEFCSPTPPASDGCLDGSECTAEIFSPPYMFAGDAARIGYAPCSISYAVNFTVNLASSSPVDETEIDKVSLVRLGSVTHSFDQNQRYMPLNFSVSGSLELSIEAPLNGDIAPPGYYMLFLVSDAGRPSQAKIVQLQ